MTLLLGVFFLMLQDGGASAAVPPQQATGGHLDALPDDIVVEALPDIDDKTSAVTHATLGSSRTSGGNPRETAIANRVKFEFSQRIAACAARGKLSSHQQLRAVVDGDINNATQVFAQDRLKRINVTCSEGTALGSFSEPNLGYSIYDRGAYFIAAIRTYAPDLRLTKRDTADSQVQSRFNAREVPRNRYRLPVDYRYFEAAICFVRVQPELSLKLVKTDVPDDIAQVEAAIVNRARICVGNARKVYFDPTQFRMYIADAVYRWAVAAKGVDSLIPAT